jgi:tripartite-type tricarboxylate transporter receptor subunit TctC
MFASLLIATSMALSLASVHAQDWPNRPIKLLVGFGAGGGTDIAARLVAQGLSEILGQPVVVENRVGAGGMTAADAVTKGPKDGTMALMMSNAHAISAVMYKTLRYDPVNEFEMVSMVATAGLALVTRPDFPASDLAGTVALIKANPGKYNFGSAGAGSTQQFAGELIKQIAGLDMRHVP